MALKNSTAAKRTSTKSPSKSSDTSILHLDTILSTAKKTIQNTFNDNEYAKTTDTLLEKLFVDSLKDMYWAEKQLVKTLPKMKKAATSPKLQKAFQDHLKQTETHVVRLEKAFAALDEKPRAKKCEAMEGLVAEGKTIISETDSGTATRDVGLILAAQKVEHYEIASYGGLAQLARTLGKAKVAQILESILKEEKEADMLLTQIAETGVNYQSSTEDEDDA
ncbi:MAG TPA: ferritin-like domain-containing protein [Alphaproteobacteria bacterium]